jgi:transcriptional regulator with XRE-family HTH domain
MFEPLGQVIRLRRIQRNLTMDRLARMAGVSRRQLSLLEDGHNVSLLFLTKIAKVLEITDLPVGDLRVRAAPPELAVIVSASEMLERIKPTISLWNTAEQEIQRTTAALDEMIERSLSAGPSARDVVEAAERLANLPAAEHDAAGKTLAALAQKNPQIRAPRPKRPESAESPDSAENAEPAQRRRRR